MFTIIHSYILHFIFIITTLDSCIYVDMCFRLLSETQKLKVLQLSHNLLSELPSDVGDTVLEELSLEHNQLMQLPYDLFEKLSKYV